MKAKVLLGALIYGAIKAKDLGRLALLQRSVLKRPDFPQFFAQLWKTSLRGLARIPRMVPDFEDD